MEATELIRSVCGSDSTRITYFDDTLLPVEDYGKGPKNTEQLEQQQNGNRGVDVAPRAVRFLLEDPTA